MSKSFLLSVVPLVVLVIVTMLVGCNPPTTTSLNNVKIADASSDPDWPTETGALITPRKLSPEQQRLVDADRQAVAATLDAFAAAPGSDADHWTVSKVGPASSRLVKLPVSTSVVTVQVSGPAASQVIVAGQFVAPGQPVAIKLAHKTDQIQVSLGLAFKTDTDGDSVCLEHLAAGDFQPRHDPRVAAIRVLD